MIEARGLTKRYGQTLAVDDLSFTVQPGRVTGFLGPNGAGKSTTMRMILGLDRPSAGDVRIGGRRYGELKKPLGEVGALLDAKWVHPNRSARSHLRWMAASNGVSMKKVDEVLELVGLTSVAGKRAGGFSLGMSQRLGLAGALLGDPKVLLFDEPVNGLDPEGILWIRQFMHRLAEQGRTVFVSSHLLSEMSLTAQDLIVIGRGRLIAHTSTKEFIEAASEARVRVRGPALDTLRSVLVASGLAVSDIPADADSPAALAVTGATTEQVGRIAGEAGVMLFELTAERGSLEQAFLQITGGAVEYSAGPSGGVPQGGDGGGRVAPAPAGFPAVASQPAGPADVDATMVKR